LGTPRISLFLFFPFFWEGGFFGALFEVLETIGPMTGEVGLHVVCTRVRCVRWGKKGQDSKKEREKWMGGVVGLQLAPQLALNKKVKSKK
jgi:hypothetical protein